MGRRARRNRHPRRFCPLDFLECVGYNQKGQGLVYYQNKVFHVDELIKGEWAKIVIYHQEDTFGSARALVLKKWSKDRVLPLGHWKFSIGSYQLAHLSNEAQDAFKQARVNKYFPQALKLKVGKRTYYRNKVSLTNGGFMAPGRGRKKVVIPQNFDLMKLDFASYPQDQVTVIRRLQSEIIAKPGTKIYAYDQMLGKKFRVGLDSFYQVNSEMAALAYQAIIDFVLPNSVVFDLFAGAAIIGIHIAHKAKKVYSVEINHDSYLDGLANIKLNQLSNIKMIEQDANAFSLNPPEKPDVIIIDPARAGLNEKSAQALNQARAKRIIYLSCNIDTQIRDLTYLTNYQIIHVQPYDFFPQTYHIENLVVLDKK